MTSEPTGFLYPFIDADEHDSSALVADLTASAKAQIAQSRALRTATLERCSDVVAQAAEEMAKCFRKGGRLFAFGNGGSATDAEGMVALFCHPPSGRGLPALSLVEDRAVLTALANDIGFDVVFSRQLIAHGRAGDIAVGFSTSGDSRNVLRALEEASRRDLLTIGLAGYEGGGMAASEAVAHCLVVHSDSVHRIQEAQDALVLRLWSIVQESVAQPERL
jgi:D-sedoheptulose 7-phosphate isomerase